MSSPFKIVFFDIDWTLYDHKNHCWPASTLSAIKELKAEGIKAVLCTARPFHSLNQFGVNNLGIDWDGYVSSAGGVAYADHQYLRKILMALFVTNGKSMRSVDFRFNAWGGNFDGLYRNYKDDDRLAAIISKRMKLLSYYLPNFVLEGGSIAVDGEGTLITTEACLLSKGRNPTFRKTEIEEVLRDFLGVEKVIWVPHGIYKDETDEHVMVISYVSEKTQYSYLKEISRDAYRLRDIVADDFRRTLNA